MAARPSDHLAVRKDFRYFHEPVPDALSATWVHGRDDRARELADRIMLSRGGAFLVSGLRGVGKTTCVRYALWLIRQQRERYRRLGEDAELVDVWINLARPLEPVQLLHHLIRHLYLQLKETGVLERLDAGLRRDLHTAFLRTSFEISSSSLVSEQRNRGTEAGFGKLPWLGIEFLGKVSTSYTKSRSDEEALKYLPYDEKAAEFDILSFSRRLLNPVEAAKSFWQRIRARLRRATSRLPRVRVVFVLDELDKLEGTRGKSQRSALDPVLETLKGVFTGSGFSFIFVGGKEVQERLSDDVSKGDSIYESIFAYDLYLPCLWDDQDNIVSTCIENPGRGVGHVYETLVRFLRYKGRGVPRRIWRELNRHVFWSDHKPSLVIDAERRRYMEVFAKVQDALSTYDSFQGSHGVEQVQLDRQRLCFYYTMDWVFGGRHERFTLAQMIAMVGKLNLGGAGDPAFPRRIAESVVQLLLARAFIELADRERTRLTADNDERLYQLAPWVQQAFHGAAPAPDEEDDEASERLWDRESVEARANRIGAYRILSKIGEGGFASVFKVLDQFGVPVAAKVLHHGAAQRSSRSFEFFQREVHTLAQLNHRNIVQLLDHGEDRGRAFLILELVEGISLRQALALLKKFTVPDACSLARAMAGVFGYVHERGFVRLDIKPSNIILTDGGEFKIVDFSIAIGADETETTTAIVGTPDYMAPEQTAGGRTDARSDIYSLGALLYEMLTGQLPPAPDEQSATNMGEDRIRPSRFVDLPDGLDAVVLKALANDPQRRFDSMAELATALERFSTSELRTTLRVLAAFGKVETVKEDKRTIDLLPDEISDLGVDMHHRTLLTPEETLTGLADTVESAILGVRSGDEDVQKLALKQLTAWAAANKRAYVVFDLARAICLWTGIDDRFCSLTFVEQSSLKLGRAVTAVDLPLSDDSISRQHVAFFRQSDIVEAEDLSTANGTLLNGNKIRRERLADGDTLKIGTTEISVIVLPADRTLFRRGASEQEQLPHLSETGTDVE